jgi:hypothetical protein
MWVDAICIEQRNEREKEEQIELMHKIYACASSVIVWLGEEGNESDEAYEAFEELRTIGKNRAANSAYTKQVSERIVKLFRRIWVITTTLQSLEFLLTDLGASRSCCSSAYTNSMQPLGN